MNIWLWIAIVFGGSLPTMVILWSIYCRRDDDDAGGPRPPNP